jgi:Ion transport protein
MMKTLSDIKFLPIMNIPFIKYLVNYQWTTVQENIKVQTLYPFYTLLALFTMFSFQIDFEEDIIKFKDWAWYSYPGYMALCGLLLTNILYFLTIEYRQARVSIKEYLSSFWNLTDLISYSLCAISVLFEMFDFNKHINRPIVATTVIILWIKLFYFLRVYDSTS